MPVVAASRAQIQAWIYCYCFADMSPTTDGQTDDPSFDDAPDFDRS